MAQQATPALRSDSSSSPLPFERLDAFDGSTGSDQIGDQLRLIREEAVRFRKEFVATGKPEYVETFDLVGAPYPRAFGLFRAATSPAPFVTITNRLVVVRWKAPGGGRKTLLFEPSDVELARNVPFYAKLAERTPELLQSLVYKEHATVEQRLAEIGVSPAEVDYLAFDHLHVQDVRRLVGTTKPASDISPAAPVTPLFPNAKLLAQRSELGLIRTMHPLQSPWYQPETYRDLPPGALMELDGDYLLGPGVALIATPGHATGNQSLVVNTGSGIWAMSENVIATECLTPEHSKIPGVRRYAQGWDQEVILNGNTLEDTAQQYNSIVKEKSIVDRSRADDRFLQFFPTSELTAHWMNVGVSPTFVHRSIHHGHVVRES